MILVTGANGLLGSYICNVLFQNGLPFKALVRRSSDLTLISNLSKDVIVEVDLYDVFETEKVLAGVSTVINCAGLVSFQRKDKSDLYRTNVEAVKNLVNACLVSDVKKFVHVSSVAALGRNKKNRKIGENTKWEDSKWNTEYAKSKYLGELEVWRGASEGLAVNVINPSVILAPYQWERSSTSILKFARRHFPFYPSGSINYVDVRDVGEVILNLLESDIGQERFIINAGAISYKSFFENVARRFQQSPPGIKLNPGLAWLGWGMEKLRSLLTQQPSLLTKETVRLSFGKSNYDNGKSHEILRQGYRSLDDTLDWVCGVSLVSKNTSREPNFQTRKIL